MRIRLLLSRLRSHGNVSKYFDLLWGHSRCLLFVTDSSIRGRLVPPSHRLFPTPTRRSSFQRPDADERQCSSAFRMLSARATSSNDERCAPLPPHDALTRCFRASCSASRLTPDTGKPRSLSAIRARHTCVTSGTCWSTSTLTFPTMDRSLFCSYNLNRNGEMRHERDRQPLIEEWPIRCILYSHNMFHKSLIMFPLFCSVHGLMKGCSSLITVPPESFP